MSGRRKSDFEKSLHSMFNSNLEKTGISIAKSIAEFAKIGALNGSRRWIGIQSRMIEGIISYKDSLLKALTEHEPEHSSVNLKDFELAKSSLNDFRDSLKKQYLMKVKAAEAVGPSLKFDDERANRELDKCIAEIERAKHFFRSKRSFWKWAIGDTKKKTFSMILLAVGGLIGHLSSDLIETVQNYISRNLS